MYEWSDLRIFLAVARAGSALAAARKLGINQTTVNRRIQALEHDLGLTLFERQNRGHTLTGQGETLLSLASQVEKAATNLDMSAQRLQRNLSGVVRLTAAEMVANLIIIPIATEFQQLHPEVRIEQIAADTQLDIVHGEADIAFRASGDPDDPRLIAQRLPDSAGALYCSVRYAQEHGTPASIDDLAAYDVVGYAGGIGRHPGVKWFITHADASRVVCHSNTVPNMTAVLRSGLGVGVLPCFIGDLETDLVRCFDPLEKLSSPLWLLTSERARAAPQVRAFIDFVVPRIRAQKAWLAGQGKP